MRKVKPRTIDTIYITVLVMGALIFCFRDLLTGLTFLTFVIGLIINEIELRKMIELVKILLDERDNKKEEE